MKEYVVRSVLVLSLLFMNVGIAQAGNWYASLHGGVGTGPESEAEVEDTSFETGPQTTSLSLDSEIGYVVMGALGYRLSPSFRVEGELSWRSNDLDTLKVNGTSIDVEGSWRNLAVMVNAAYDLPVGGAFRPFILGGIGVANVEADIETGASFPLEANKDDTVFAYQAGVGVSYVLTPHVSFNVAYRLFGTLEPDLEEGEGVEIENSIHHNGLVGLTYSF